MDEKTSKTHRRVVGDIQSFSTPPRRIILEAPVDHDHSSVPDYSKWRSVGVVDLQDTSIHMDGKQYYYGNKAPLSLTPVDHRILGQVLKMLGVTLRMEHPSFMLAELVELVRAKGDQITLMDITHLRARALEVPNEG